MQMTRSLSTQLATRQVQYRYIWLSVTSWVTFLFEYLQLARFCITLNLKFSNNTFWHMPALHVNYPIDFLKNVQLPNCSN